MSRTLPGTSETCTLGESGSTGNYSGGVKRFFQYEGRLYVQWTSGNCSDIQDAIFGEDGIDGADGRGVQNIYINEEGDLIVVLTDNTEINLGPLPEGPAGQDGADGQDGVTPHIGENGNWFIGEHDTGVPARGPKGEDGADGQDRADGQDGRGIIKTEIINGELWIYYSDETSENLGSVVGKDGKDGKDGKAGEFDLSSGSSGSSNNPRCTAAIATVGIPLLALSPLALATQVNIPGLSPMIASAQAQLQNFNTNLQQQSGIYDPNTANFMAQVNAELNKSGVNIGQVAGAAVLLTVGDLALKHVVDNCLPA